MALWGNIGESYFPTPQPFTAFNYDFRPRGDGGPSAWQRATYRDLYNQWQQQYREAREANEKRYGEILGVYDTAYEAYRQGSGKTLSEMQAANEALYQQILGERQGYYGSIESQLAGLGGQARQDILNQFAAAANAGRMALTDRGLANTTILPSILGGYTREETAALNRLSDQLTRQRMDVLVPLKQGIFDFEERKIGRTEREAQGWLDRLARLTGLKHERAGFMERRTDKYPDLGLLVQLALGMGRGGRW